MNKTLASLVLLSTNFVAAQTAPATSTTPYGGPQAVLYIAPMSCSGGSCGNNAGSEFEAALTQALQNSGYFRVVKREEISNLSISGGVTNIEGGSTAGFLIFATSKIKVKAAIQVTDPATGELVFTQQCEGDSTSNAISILGFSAGESSGYGKAAADCATRLTKAITSSNRVQSFLKYAPGSALPAPRSAASAAAPASAPLPLASASSNGGASGTISAEQVNTVLRMLEGTIKTLAFNDLNSLFTSDVINPVKVKELDAAATADTLKAASSMTFKVSSVENVGMMQVVGVTYTLPSGTEKFVQVGLVGEGQLNTRGGVRLLYMSAFNPMRSLPQFESLSRNTENLLSDVLSSLGLPKP